MNKNNNLGRFILVIVIIAWALIEIYPPTSRDLVQQFASRAQNRDAAFTNILSQTAALQKAGTNNEFVALQLAIGTNDLQKFFPFYASAAANQVRPNTYILNRLQRDASGQIKLGIDLQGGTSFLMEMDTSKLINVVTSTNAQGQAETVTNTVDAAGALSQAIEVLRKRIDRFGVAEPVIQSAGPDRILVQLPGLSESDKESAREQLQKSAYLEFRMVHDNSAEIIKNGDPIPPGYQLMKYSVRSKNNQMEVQSVIVKKKAENNLAGDIVESARFERGSQGPEIDFTLTDEAAARFAETTHANIGHQMAVILDGELQTAPVIRAEISKSGQITGDYTPEEAQSIANVLQNPLRAPLRIVSSYDVGATLGQDSINSGIKASVYGVLWVSLFMFVYYRLAGLAANVALITNVIILLGVMCSIGTTFTLPGIAGAVLTVGMAVDANVLIYERLREELAKGKSLRGAIEAGYARAFGTIFDSHVTTLISSIILIWKGTGEIQGFGVTLTIGVAASLFTALVVTRLIFNFLVDRNIVTSLTMMHVIKSSKVNFMGIAKPLFVATWLFALISIGFGVTRGEKLFGIDFLGGDRTSFSYTQQHDLSDIRAALPAQERDAQIQYQTSGNVSMLTVISGTNTSTTVESALKEKFPQANYAVVDRQEVGATIGGEILQSGIVASLLAMFGILMYVAFRYEFSFAVAAVIAVLHDVLFAIGAYCLANAISGRQFNATVVAAILTIIGFSINDKIVIFDRIREDLKLGMRGTFEEVINTALNQTLSRTIITSGTVLIATACLYFLGGGVINDFAFTFLVGIIVGTYSSIYVASLIVLKWHKGQRPAIGTSQVTVQNAAQNTPAARA